MFLMIELIHLIRVIKKQEFIIKLNVGLTYSFVTKKCLLVSNLIFVFMVFKKKINMSYQFNIRLFVLNSMFINNGIVFLYNQLNSVKFKVTSKINFFIKNRSCFTINRSPFVYKKSMEQFGLDLYGVGINFNIGVRKKLFVLYLESIIRNNILTLCYSRVLIKKKSICINSYEIS